MINLISSFQLCLLQLNSKVGARENHFREIPTKKNPEENRTQDIKCRDFNRSFFFFFDNVAAFLEDRKEHEVWFQVKVEPRFFR